MQTPVVLQLDPASLLRLCGKCQSYYWPIDDDSAECPTCASAVLSANPPDPFAVNFDVAPEGFDYHAYGPSGVGEWWRVCPDAHFYGWDALGQPPDCWQVSGYGVPIRLVNGEAWQTTRRARAGG